MTKKKLIKTETLIKKKRFIGQVNKKIEIYLIIEK